MVSKLCKHYSPALLSLPVPDGADAETYHAFPPPSVLADPAVSTTLRGLGFGYRADFIQRTALMLVDAHGTERDTKSAREAAETWLLTLRDMDTTAARDELVKFVGVGRKV
jgi:N-glycosylase/DNA lyase